MPGPRADRSPRRWLAAAALALLVAAPAGAQKRVSISGRQGPVTSSRQGPLPYAGAAARYYGQLGGTSVPYPGTLAPPAVSGSYAVSPGYYPNCPPYNPCYPPPCPPVYYAPYPVYNGVGLGYGGFYAAGNFGGVGVAVGLPAQQQVVINRRVVVVAPPVDEAATGSGERVEPHRGNGSSGEGQLRPVAPSGGATEPARGDGFYLTRPSAAEGLSEALKDLRRAWLNGDFLRLKDRFAAGVNIRLFPGGKYGSTMSADEFAKMSRDALQAIETSAFEFEPPTMSGPDRAFVTGRHTFTAPGPDGGKRSTSVYISYTLELKDGLWRITEAGSGAAPITGHAGG